MATPQATSTTSKAKAQLELNQVLKNLESSLPKILSAVAKEHAAQEKANSSRGHWDPKFESKGIFIPQGPYESARFEASIRQETPLWGLALSVGYRLGQGEFPSYANYKTLDQGEFAASLELPLLNGRKIDLGRAGISSAQLKTKSAHCQRLLNVVRASYEASYVYWNWVEAGHILRIQQELLDMAEKRVVGLRERIKAGSMPPIIIQDNHRQILERRTEVIEAQRKLTNAAYKLSLYYRDREGTPIIPTIQTLPINLPPLISPQTFVIKEKYREAISKHPMLCVMSYALSILHIERSLAENEKQPSLNLSAFVAKDIGTGQVKLSPTEVGGGITFKVPIGLNKAIGEFKRIQAQITALEEELRGMRDYISVELQQADSNLKATFARAEIAREQVKVAWSLVEAEHIKLAEGASDLMILNLRELSYAKAEALEVKAIINYFKSVASYQNAKGSSQFDLLSNAD